MTTGYKKFIGALGSPLRPPWAQANLLLFQKGDAGNTQAETTHFIAHERLGLGDRTCIALKIFGICRTR